MRSFVVTLLIAFFAMQSTAYAEERKELQLEDAHKHLSLTLHAVGWSHHDTGKKPNRFNERNPMLGVGWTFDHPILLGKPFIEIGRVFANSKNGRTDYATVGIDWEVYRYQKITFGASAGITKIRYEDPTRRSLTTLAGTVPTVSLKLGVRVTDSQELGVRCTPLGSKITFCNAYLLTTISWL